MIYCIEKYKNICQAIYDLECTACERNGNDHVRFGRGSIRAVEIWMTSWKLVNGIPLHN